MMDQLTLQLIEILKKMQIELSDLNKRISALESVTVNNSSEVKPEIYTVDSDNSKTAKERETLSELIEKSIDLALTDFRMNPPKKRV